MPEQKFSIATSIPYVNAQPHIGFAMELLYADVLARYHRQRGHDVHFATGTDEHGQKVFDTAVKLHKTPQEHVDHLSSDFRKLLEPLQISTTDFVRTTEERHTRAAHAFWKRMIDSGDIEKGSYSGLYCVGCESFKTEKELVDGVCAIHKTAPQTVQEENYFFRLSRYQERLLKYYAEHSDFVVPQHRFREMEEIVRGGLEDISISREKEKLSWGVPVPSDDTQVMYVWFEALLNYMTTFGYGSTTDAQPAEWPVDYIIVGKDINRFHSITFAAMMMAAGFDLPKHIGVHGFITVDGQKMSKSIGNVVNPFDIVKTYGTDATRYFLLREIPFYSDGDFSHDRLRERYSADLANALGNLVSRVTNMVEKYCAGELESSPNDSAFGVEEKIQYADALEQLKFSQALEVIWKVVYDANEYIEREKPWVLAKSDTPRLKTVLQHLLYALELVDDWLVPFIPETAQKISDALHATPIVKAEPLFPRLELSEENKQT